MIFFVKQCYNVPNCSEGKSFFRNDAPDKAQAEMLATLSGAFVQEKTL